MNDLAKYTETNIDDLLRRLLSFCNQLAKDEHDPVRRQILDLCKLAKIGLSAVKPESIGQ